MNVPIYFFDECETIAIRSITWNDDIWFLHLVIDKTILVLMTKFAEKWTVPAGPNHQHAPFFYSHFSEFKSNLCQKQLDQLG